MRLIYVRDKTHGPFQESVQQSVRHLLLSYVFRCGMDLRIVVHGGLQDFVYLDFLPAPCYGLPQRLRHLSKIS